jgi:NAD(P)-dependent dehydrogenase (short-subunit alcohol dehydrogenase family)
MQSLSTSKYCLITGSAKRLGSHLAKHLAEGGYDIVLHYNQSKELAEKTANQVKSIGRQCLLIQQDLSIPGAEKVLDQSIVHFGATPALLINNASIFYPTDFSNCDHQVMEKFFNVHFHSPFQLNRHYFNRHQGEGQIINIVDTRVNWTDTNFMAYSLSKTLLKDSTRYLAKAMHPRIRVNAIAPGAIIPPEVYCEQAEKKTYGSLNDITNTLDFFLNTPFVTGEMISVDGGEKLFNERSL